LESDEATVVINVNSAPVANADTFSTPINTRIVFDVTTNDIDSDGSIDRTTVQIVSPASSGVARVLADGRIEYTPTATFTGTATLSYNVRDNAGTLSNTAQVTIRVGASEYQNPRLNVDVNNDGFVSPIDALLVINDLNKNGVRTLQPGEFTPPPFIDVTGDRRIDPSDVLTVINYLNNSGGGGGEGEGEGEADSINIDAQAGAGAMLVTMVTPEQMLATVANEVATVAQQHLLSIIGRSCAAVVGEGESNDDGIAGWDDDLTLIAKPDDRNESSLKLEDVFASDLDDLLS
jgi:hypothetical protein